MSHIDTLVIGAGVSGLTTARLLTQAGQRVVVLESRDRIGGRVCSEQDERGVITDLGASWIHGVQDEPLAELVHKLGIETVEFTAGAHQAGGRPIANFSSNGSRFTSGETERWEQDIAEVKGLLGEAISKLDRGVSFQEIVTQTLQSLPWDDTRLARVRQYFRQHPEEQYGAEWDELDAHGLDSDEVVGDEVIFPNGYSQLPLALAAGLDIRLGHCVSRITWGTSGVVVRANHSEFSASRVVVTLPVGVLQHGDVAFEPPLPADVSLALSRLRMNAFEKVFVEFPEQFWDNNVYALRQHGAAGSTWHSWYDLTRATGKPTLLAFAGGNHARRIITQSRSEIITDVLSALTAMYGDAVPTPTKLTVTNWQDDPFSRGSYAYMTVGSAIEDHDNLALPLGDGALHMSGEATWGEDPATVPGALRSGHRVAERILGQTLNILDLAD